MKVVLANGCFDCLHYGHLLHLEAAKRMGDFLIVSVTRDDYVNKPDRPIFNESQRAAMVGALRCVDRVVLVNGLLSAIVTLEPDIVVKGPDYSELEIEHADYCIKHGIEVRFTNTPKFSTTELINEARRRS